MDDLDLVYFSSILAVGNTDSVGELGCISSYTYELRGNIIVVDTPTDKYSCNLSRGQQLLAYPLVPLATQRLCATLCVCRWVKKSILMF